MCVFVGFFFLGGGGEGIIWNCLMSDTSLDLPGLRISTL